MQTPTNPSGIGGFQKGQRSANPGGRPKGAIADLSREARKRGGIVGLDALVNIAKGGAIYQDLIRHVRAACAGEPDGSDRALAVLAKVGPVIIGIERNRAAAANALHDRGYGKPVTQIDLVTSDKKMAQMDDVELAEFIARCRSEVGDGQGDLLH